MKVMAINALKKALKFDLDKKKETGLSKEHVENAGGEGSQKDCFTDREY